jgi:hypothetical protein
VRVFRPRRRAAAALLAAAAVTAAVAAAERVIDVRGTITDSQGRGLAGQIVRLFKTRRQFTLKGVEHGGQVAEAARVTTDAAGFYQLSVPRDRSFDEYYLRFYDPNGFDSVQYLVPPDRDITHDLKREQMLRIDVTLERTPAWPEVARRIEAEGAESPKGRILLALGLPEREGMGSGPDGPREEWWYHTHGVVYFFRDGKPAGSRRFDPVSVPPEIASPQAASSGGSR